MKTEIPWRHYFLCMAIYGIVVTVLESAATLTPMLCGIVLLATVSAYLVVARSRVRRS